MSPTCPVCREATLPDAFVCQHCGASLPGPITGVTQRLSAPAAKVCPKCQGMMTAGFPVSFHPGVELWWVAGESEPQVITRSIHGQWHPLISIIQYRCEGCWYLEAYAPPLPSP